MPRKRAAKYGTRTWDGCEIIQLKVSNRAPNPIGRVCKTGAGWSFGILGDREPYRGPKKTKNAAIAAVISSYSTRAGRSKFRRR